MISEMTYGAENYVGYAKTRGFASDLLGYLIDQVFPKNSINQQVSSFLDERVSALRTRIGHDNGQLAAFAHSRGADLLCNGIRTANTSDSTRSWIHKHGSVITLGAPTPSFT